MVKHHQPRVCAQCAEGYEWLMEQQGACALAMSHVECSAVEFVSVVPSFREVDAKGAVNTDSDGGTITGVADVAEQGDTPGGATFDIAEQDGTPGRAVAEQAITRAGSHQRHTRTTPVVCVLGWYLLRPRWVPCWSALAALVAGGVV